jgi:hypothetical protein
MRGQDFFVPRNRERTCVSRAFSFFLLIGTAALKGRQHKFVREESVPFR